MADDKITLVAACIAALAGITSVFFQISSNRRIATMGHTSKAQSRLLSALPHLQELNEPLIQEVPFIINREEELPFLKKHTGHFCIVAEKHARMAESLLDTFDTDIRGVVEKYTRDFQQAYLHFQQPVNQNEAFSSLEEVESFQKELREIACYCHVLCNVVREGIRVQIDRFSQKLLSRRRYMNNDINYDFDYAFYISPQVRRVFNPEWQDWP